MSATNDGGPAFPQHGWSSNPEVLRRMNETGGGMTLRDWFAGQALENLAHLYMADYRNQQDGPVALSKECYAVADAMLAAREGGAK